MAVQSILVNVTDVSNHQYVQPRNRVVQFTAEAMAASRSPLETSQPPVPVVLGTPPQTPLSSAEGENSPHALTE